MCNTGKTNIQKQSYKNQPTTMHLAYRRIKAGQSRSPNIQNAKKREWEIAG